MDRWDLNELRQLILEKLGPTLLDNVAIHINSVAWKMQLATYHKFVSHHAFDKIIENSEYKIIDSVKLLFDPNTNGTFSEARIIAEANAIACAQSMYSVQDLLSYVVFYIFNLTNYDGKKTLTDIYTYIPSKKVKSQIQSLTGSHRFLYLKDFVNQTKHVSLVESAFNADFKDITNIQQGMKFEAFSYIPGSSKPRKHKSKWYKEFLMDIEIIEKAYVSIGKEINDYLKHKQ